jgi:hypothetical protein
VDEPTPRALLPVELVAALIESTETRCGVSDQMTWPRIAS